MREITVDNICVDAGLIIVADWNYFKQFESVKFEKRLSQVIEVPNGKYKVEWNIPDTWNGDIEGIETLEITSGNIVVSDPCYLIQGDNQKQWVNWLNATDYGEKLNSDNGFTIHSMGGDGGYRLNLRLTKI